jgi:GPN-loop GTPase
MYTVTPYSYVVIDTPG